MIIQKVAAYITRPRPAAPDELLVFAHPSMPEVPIQVPAGTVDPGETLEAALWREIAEESGLRAVRLIRKLGVQAFQTAHLQGQRHYYLLSLTAPTPDHWEHSVQGTGLDAGMVFSYYWTNGEQGFEVCADQAIFLCPEYIPELFWTAKP